ncbi:unnamed protein product [Nezara viridula]|uniref:Uncharacterized protein n=1 Tax=Nezara viridula TaxID=85310 RepID=A0A9P0HW37_NEZVI|nr:unnamed protein product [Nezara viridula]CAH1408427.1 unnamed protein product [Nezara viridula]
MKKNIPCSEYSTKYPFTYYPRALENGSTNGLKKKRESCSGKERKKGEWEKEVVGGEEARHSDRIDLEPVLTRCGQLVAGGGGGEEGKEYYLKRSLGPADSPWSAASRLRYRLPGPPSPYRSNIYPKEQRTT